MSGEKDYENVVDKMIEEQKKEFVDGAIKSGFTSIQAEFLWDKIKSKTALDSMFGMGIF